MNGSEALLGLGLELTRAEPSKPRIKTGDGFADQTRKAVDDIVENVTIESAKEIAELRRALDDLENVLISRAARTKDTMTTYVDLVVAGRDLTRLLRDRVQVMRSTLDEVLSHADARVQ